MLGELWRASRPFSWINTALPFLAVAWTVQHGLTTSIVLGVLYFLAPYNLLLYGVNDLYDYESDRVNPRKGGTIEGGLLAPSCARGYWMVTAATNLPFLFVLIWLGGAPVAVTLAVTAAVALAYSIPPIRTKVVPGLDSVTSSLHFVLPAIAGGIVAGAHLAGLPWRFLCAFFFWGMASQALGAIQDVSYDRSAGIGSIAVALGPRGTALFSGAGYIAAVLLVASRGDSALVVAAALLPYVLLAASCLTGDAERQARRAWHAFLGLNLLTGFIVTQVLLRVWGATTVSVLDLLAWGSASGVLAVLIHSIVNELAMRRKAPSLAHLPLVSIVIPVRNETRTIADCLEGIRSQQYDSEWETIVVDDGSTDETALVARALLRPGDRLLQPSPAPTAWTGKCWAAHHGARAARGKVLIFLDADTVLHPTALQSLVAEIARTGGLLSILSRYDMKRTVERIFMPAFVQMQACLVPIAWLNAVDGRRPAFAYAYGPCMVVARRDYDAAGGHAAIRSSDREDVDLARLFRSAGSCVRLLRGADIATTRHYRSLQEIVGCWRRTYYAYGGNSLAVALFGMLGTAVIFLLPLVVLFAALTLSDESALVGSLVGLAGLTLLRFVIVLQERQPLSTVLWHPVTWLGTLAFQALSVADGLRGLPPRWRGRTLSAEVPG